MSPQWHPISEQQLSKMVAQGTYAGAGAAVERVRKIRTLGHRPAIFFDKFNGYMVLDEDDREQRKRIDGLGKRPRGL
jgi:hypothetical protein